MRTLWQRFWAWYERHYTLNIGITAGLFCLQLVHLYWLTTHVVFQRLFEVSLFNPNPTLELIIILVDYTEIPAILATSLVYINEFRKNRSVKSILFLLFLNSQWLHLFWITDEIVADQFVGESIVTFPIWLAWLAIGIDYLELPVIYDTLNTFFSRLIKKPQA
jgi:hypothetical protein